VVGVGAEVVGDADLQVGGSVGGKNEAGRKGADEGGDELHDGLRFVSGSPPARSIPCRMS
jgi:hypothetical protein